jgi:hypothetical protein
MATSWLPGWPKDGLLTEEQRATAREAASTYRGRFRVRGRYRRGRRPNRDLERAGVFFGAGMMSWGDATPQQEGWLLRRD